MSKERSSAPDAAALADQLLGLDSADAQLVLIDETGLMDDAGLSALLGEAGRRIGRSPGEAILLANLCGRASEQVGATRLLPMSEYLSAQAHAISGSLDEALALIRRAQEGYRGLGDRLAALNSNLGLIHVLNELGRHDEAIEAGEEVLRALAGAEEGDEGGVGGGLALPEPERNRMLAAVGVNLGACYRRKGRFQEALDLLDRAEKAFQAMGQDLRVADLRMNRGNIYRSLGRGAEAMADFDAAIEAFDAAEMPLQSARALTNRAYAQLGRGEYAPCLDSFENARAGFEAAEGQEANLAVLRLDASEAQLALNLYPEALAGFESCVEDLDDAGMAFEHGRALWGLGAALAAESREKEAAEMLAKADARFEAAGNGAQLAGLRLDQALLLHRRGEQEAAIAMAEDALDLARGGGWTVEAILARLLLSDLVLPDLEQAEAHLIDAQTRSEGVMIPHLQFRIDWRLGRIRRLTGDRAEALRLLEQAIALIESDRLELSRESLRRSFLRDKTEAYENLLELHLTAGDEVNLRRAFEVAERAKSRALVDLLIGRVDDRLPSVDDPELLARLNDLRADLNSIYNTMLGGSREGERAVALDMLQQRAVELEREISSLQVQVRVPLRDDPFGDADAVSDFQAQLAPSEILLAYHVVNDEVIAFLSDQHQMRVVRDVCRASGILAHLWRLSAQFDRFQVGAGFAAKHEAQLEASARRVLAALYDALVRPLAPALREMSVGVDGVPQLTIVPHGALHQVPFHALFDGERYLIDDFEIAYAPSTTVKFLCQTRAPRHMGESLVMAVDDPRIPAAVQEAHSVASWLEGATVLVGAEARCEELSTRAGECDVVHLACHGMFRADNPMYSSLQLHDGWLTADDILGLRLDGALVTLSACESGRGQVIGGDEVLGLSRAFLGAGAASLAVSLWLVQDETTAELMTDWYHGLHDGKEPAASLREAQLRLKAEHPHPYYWAPFILLGRR